jgi:hypothetical protein
VNGSLQGPLSATTPNGVRLHNPSSSKNGLKQISAFITDSWTIDKLTLNVGARFDRYTPWLPAQAVPASRFNPVEAQLPENSWVLTFNHIVPRFGAIYDLMGDGKTVLKANWGRFYYNTGVNLADAVNPNTSNQYADYTWNDFNNDRVYQPGEEGTQGANFRYTGVASVAIDENLKNSYTDEASFFIEREVMRDLGVRAGYVWKKDNDGWQQIVPNRPFSAYNVPVTVVDPGPDGSVATTADNGTLQLFNLDNPAGRPITQFVTNIDDYEGTYRTVEFSSNKRYSNRWSMNASFSYTFTEEWNRTYFNNVFATAVNQFSLFGAHATNPNERTFHDFTNWSLKFSGTVDAGWGLRVTPVLQSQSGAPYGRIVNVAGCSATVTANCLNYGAQAVLAEPIGTRRQDTITKFDFRVEKQIRFAAKARVGLFFDMFNVTNSNTPINITWTSGARFERATTVIPPRIAKFGVKFDW